MIIHTGYRYTFLSLYIIVVLETYINLFSDITYFLEMYIGEFKYFLDNTRVLNNRYVCSIPDDADDLLSKGNT